MNDMFGAPTPDDVSLLDQAAAVEREITMRQRVYPRFVASGRMTQEKADRELLAMRAALITIERVRAAEALLAEAWNSEEMEYDAQGVNQAHRVLLGGDPPRATREHPVDEGAP